MSDSHDKLPKLFWVQLALAAVIGIVFLMTPSKHKGDHGTEEGKIAEVAKNLEPVGAVATKAASGSESKVAARSGEEVYKASCMSCHDTGIANAPKPDDKAAWEPRVAAGMDSMMNTAINGKGAMPAKGGNPAITDEEIRATVLYMTKRAGFDLSSAGSSGDNAAAPTAEAKTTMETAKQEVEKMAEKVMPAVAAVVPTAPKAPKAPEAPKAMEAAPKSAMTMAETPAPAAEQTAAAPTVDLKKGEEIYNGACFACHAAGVAGSPKLGDIELWAPRIAAGKEVLYTAAIKGKGIMPPKGGNMGLSDDDVKAAVDYMIAKSQ